VYKRSIFKLHLYIVIVTNDNILNLFDPETDSLVQNWIFISQCCLMSFRN